ncbi:DUF6468 domain-containing protein [Stappia stellulata]|uniref:DUF6468 domain-containing protein n=1 Tax=Stappia stellulata TaxID=71235 RepID=UPI00041EFDCD|nr:DUF6468 domain-containing protein [Stappia stellulata]
MSTLPLGLIIESLVAVLLVVTIGYCVVLNKRLKRLRADEESLRATISELITASEIAERAILGLKATAGEADRTLGERLVAAERLSCTLSEQIVTGNTVLERITQIAEAAKPAAAVPPMPAAAEPAQAPRSGSMRANDIRSAAMEATARLEHFRKRAAEQAA